MQQSTAVPVDMKVLMNHIYEYKKGVRRMVLFTFNKQYEDVAIRRLESQNIKYVIQPVGSDRLNLYFGREECLNAIRMIATRPLNLLTPEEDFYALGLCLDMIYALNARGTVSVRTEKAAKRACQKLSYS